MKVYGILRVLLGGFFRFFYNIRIEGAENEPKEGSFVVCSNHLSNHDVLILAVSIKHQLRFFAKKELFGIPILKHIVNGLGAFPVDRKSPSSALVSMKTTATLLEQGEVVGFFPQGKRCPGVNPSETTFKAGIGSIVYRTHATVLPVCIQTKKWRVIPFRRVNVTIGKPLLYSDMEFVNGGSDEYINAAEKVFGKISEAATASEMKSNAKRSSRK